MQRPLEGVTAIVLGTGPDLPADRLGAFDPYFTIGVGRFWRVARGFVPTVAFWIDAAVGRERPEWFGQGQVCVCDAGLTARPGGVSLPLRGGPLPRHAEQLDPRRLYHRPNAGVVAAIWAVSLGCRPVVLCGMGCEPDARPPSQRAAMETARNELLRKDYRLEEDWRSAVWPWDRAVVDTPAVWQSCLHSRRLQASDTCRTRNALRQFYATEPARE